MADSDGFAARLRGFGPVGIAVILFVLLALLLVGPLTAILVMLWAWYARVSWRDMGFDRPRSWALTIGGGIIAGILLKLALKAVVMPLIGAPAINSAYHYVSGNPAALTKMIITVIVAGGIGEEIVYRGFLFERLRGLLGRSATATAAIIVLTTALFASAHFAEQGIAGSEQAVFTGLTFAVLYILTGSLWLSIVTHASYDVVALVMIYFDIEGAVARSVLGS